MRKTITDLKEKYISKYGFVPDFKAGLHYGKVIAGEIGIIKREIVSDYPIRVEYSLTNLGKEFEPVLLAAGSFSMKYMPKIVFKDGKSRTPNQLLVNQK